MNRRIAESWKFMTREAIKRYVLGKKLHRTLQAIPRPSMSNVKLFEVAGAAIRNTRSLVEKMS